VFLRKHHNVVAFLMIFIWVHHDLHMGSSCMNVDEFLGSSYACQMNLWVLSMSSVICTNIRMLLDNAFPDFALECV